MVTTPSQPLAAVLLGLTILAAGAGLLAPRWPVAVAEETTPAARAEDLQPLLKARYEAAKDELEARRREFEAGRGTLDLLFEAAGHALKSRTELSDKPGDHVAALQEYLDVVKDIFQINRERFEAGRIAIQDLKLAEYHHLDAQIQLARAKAK
jgi:outer membrane protein TolC